MWTAPKSRAGRMQLSVEVSGSVVLSFSVVNTLEDLLRPPVVAAGTSMQAKYSHSVRSSSSPSKLFQSGPVTGTPTLPQSLGTNRYPGLGKDHRKSLLPSGRISSLPNYISETFTLTYNVECQHRGRKTTQVVFVCTSFLNCRIVY
jgi:hypothetical protein